MKFRVDVVARDPSDRPPAGSPVFVEVRDVTLIDAPSTVVAAAMTTTTGDMQGPVASVTLELTDPAKPTRDLVLWARIAVQGAERVAVGDWITMQSVPAPGAGISVAELEVRQVR